MTFLFRAMTLALLLAATLVAAYSHAATLSFKYEDLRRILETSKPKSTAELISLLPSAFKNHFALVKDSGSLQESTDKNPRVILYGDGDLVITFNGDPSQAGFEAIEITHYDWTKHEFVFEEHVFENDLAARAASIRALKPQEEAQALLSELSNRQDRSGTNPQLCLQCHESSHHPLLPVYPASSAFMGGYFGEKTEQSWISNLMSIYSSNERFRQLGLRGKELNRLVETGSQNRVFNQLMNFRNADRLAYILTQAKPTLIKELIATLADCDGTPATREKRARDFIEGKMRISMAENFTTDGGFGSYNFSGADGGIERLLPHLLLHLKVLDPIHFDTISQNDSPARICAELKSNSTHAVWIRAKQRLVK